MSDNLHIIITSDEGKAHTLLFSKKTLKLSGLIAVSLCVVVAAITYGKYYFSSQDAISYGSLAKLNKQLQDGTLEKDKDIVTLSNQIADLNSQLDESKLLQNTMAQEVTNLQELNSGLAEDFQKEKSTLLNSAVSELEERSDIIERIIGNIGLKLFETPKENNNSGGPFIAPRETIGKELLFRSDHYLNTIKTLPLGRPIPGVITSRFGHRTDPVNGKKGFHTGVDLRGPSGQHITSTADGFVTRAFFNGSYGRYIEIKHGSGYTTKYAHMKKLLVKRGDKVTRGQTIGTVGSSGRSTGSHLHYEICLHNKAINPNKYMRIDKLVKKLPVPRIHVKAQQKLKY